MPMNGDTLRSQLGRCKTHADRYISQILKGKKLNEPFQNEHLKQLIMYAPNHKTMNFRCFVKRLMPPYYKACLTVNTNRDEVVLVSWRTAVAKLYGKYDAKRKTRERALQAFREEIACSPEMVKAREACASNRCAECKKKCKLHIDHDVKPFSQILDEFLAEKKLKLVSVRVNCMVKPFLLVNRGIARAWVAWHDEHATLIGLCKKCNCSKGSSGYKHKQ